MKESDVLKQKRNQYISAYNQAALTAEQIYQALKTISTMIDESKACYTINESDVGGKYLKQVYDSLSGEYDYVVQTVLPQTKGIINSLTNDINNQILKEVNG